MPKYDRDLLNSAPVEEVASATFDLLTRLDKYPPHVQLLGAAALLRVIVDHYRVHPQDVMTVTSALLDSVEASTTVEVKALREYVKHELK